MPSSTSELSRKLDAAARRMDPLGLNGSKARIQPSFSCSSYAVTSPVDGPGTFRRRKQEAVTEIKKEIHHFLRPDGKRVEIFDPLISAPFFAQNQTRTEALKHFFELGEDCAYLADWCFIVPPKLGISQWILAAMNSAIHVVAVVPPCLLFQNAKPEILTYIQSIRLVGDAKDIGYRDDLPLALIKLSQHEESTFISAADRCQSQ